MPLVRTLRRGNLRASEPDTTQNPDEAVALGATIQAGILSGAVRDVVLAGHHPTLVGHRDLRRPDERHHPAEHHSSRPRRAKCSPTPWPGQGTVRIHVVQGEREKAADNWTLGSRLTWAFTAWPPVVSARVGVQFEIDADGILHVLARDTKTGEERVVEMRSAVDVSDEQVEQNDRRIGRARLRGLPRPPARGNATQEPRDAARRAARDGTGGRRCCQGKSARGSMRWRRT